MLVKNKILSVNQVAAQIKLTKVWKSINNEKYPINMKKKWDGAQEERKELRPESRRELEEGGKTRMAKESFVRNRVRIWNQALLSIKLSKP